MKKFSKYIGLDVHKETISVAGSCEKMLGQSAAHLLSPCESERLSPALVTVPIFSQLPVAEERGGEPRYWGEIKNRPEEVRRLLLRLDGPDPRLQFCYEAGPRGYGLYRQLVAAGHACAVVAPGLIPRKPG